MLSDKDPKEPHQDTPVPHNTKWHEDKYVPDWALRDLNPIKILLLSTTPSECVIRLNGIGLALELGTFYFGKIVCYLYKSQILLLCQSRHEYRIEENVLLS